MLDLDSS